MSMRVILRIIWPVLVVLCLHPCAEAQSVSSPCEPSVTGRVELIPFVSRVFHNQRYLRVWLPPGYFDSDNAGTRYSALYVMDGELLFGDCPYGMKNPDWGFDETLTE